MSLPLPEKNNFDARNGLTPFSLLANSLRIPVEQLVTEYLAAVEVAGVEYLSKLLDAVQKYL